MPQSPQMNALVEDPRREGAQGQGELHPEAGRANAPLAHEGRAVQESFQIPSLDGIRAISFLIVFLSHAGLSTFIPGYFGLTVFFFLSGYLITTLLRMEFDRTGTISLKQFYLRRTLRIFPPLYLVLAGACAMVLFGFVRGSVLPWTVLAQAAHLTNYYIIHYGWWRGIAPGTWVYWSLAVEEHFYIFFPLLYLGMRRLWPSGSKQAWALLAICAVVLVWRCVLIFHFHVYKDRTYLATDTRVDAILTGCILAVWQNPVLDRDSIADHWLRWVWAPLGVAAIVVSLLASSTEFEQTLRYTLQSFGLFPLFIVAIRWHDRGLLRVLNWRPIRRLGVLSYSLYLMHTAVIWAFKERSTLGTALQGVASFMVLIVLATVIHRYVEMPFARVRKRLSRHLDPQSGAVDRSAPMAA
jgi:peptidoglycan/LPS O-acetylase OafA/YrhL